MHRPEDKTPTEPTASAPSNRGAEAGMPEHVLLRLMRDAEADVDAALELAARIAASVSLSSERGDDRGDTAHGTDESEAAMEHDPNEAPERNAVEPEAPTATQQTEQTEVEMEEEADDGLAALLVEDFVDEPPAAEQPSKRAPNLLFPDPPEAVEEPTPETAATEEPIAPEATEQPADNALFPEFAAASDAGIEQPQEHAEQAAEPLFPEFAAADDAPLDVEDAVEGAVEQEQEPAAQADDDAADEEAAPVVGEVAEEVEVAAAAEPPQDEEATADEVDDEPAERAEPAAEQTDDDDDLFAEPARAEPAEATHAATLTSASLDRVQEFLGELKTTLVELARREPAEPAQLDVAPLVDAVREGFARSAEQGARTEASLTSIAEHMGRVEGELQRTVAAAAAATSAAPARAPAVPASAPTRAGQPLVLGAVGLLVLGWSVLFWMKTGSTRLALGTLVGANAVACCLLMARRGR